MSNRTTNEMVREFHEKFDHPVREEGMSLASMSPERILLRYGLVMEEFTELTEALFGREAAHELEKAYSNMHDDHYIDEPENWALDDVEVADALGDMDYVINGFAHEAGDPHDKVVEEIHSSNMSKMGPDGKPILRADGKILKGPDYFRPDIARVLQETTNESTD